MVHDRDGHDDNEESPSSSSSLSRSNFMATTNNKNVNNTNHDDDQHDNNNISTTHERFSSATLPFPSRCGDVSDERPDENHHDDDCITDDATTDSFEQHSEIARNENSDGARRKLASVDTHASSSASSHSAKTGTIAATATTNVTATATSAIIPKITITNFPVLSYAPDPASSSLHESEPSTTSISTSEGDVKVQHDLSAHDRQSSLNSRRRTARFYIASLRLMLLGASAIRREWRQMRLRANNPPPSSYSSSSSSSFISSSPSLDSMATTTPIKSPSSITIPQSVAVAVANNNNNNSYYPQHRRRLQPIDAQRLAITRGVVIFADYLCDLCVLDLNADISSQPLELSLPSLIIGITIGTYVADLFSGICTYVDQYHFTRDDHHNNNDNDVFDKLFASCLFVSPPLSIAVSFAAYATGPMAITLQALAVSSLTLLALAPILDPHITNNNNNRNPDPPLVKFLRDIRFLKKKRKRGVVSTKMSDEYVRFKERQNNGRAMWQQRRREVDEEEDQSWTKICGVADPLVRRVVPVLDTCVALVVEGTRKR